MSQQQSTPEPHKLEATVFIYRHKRTGKTQAHYIDVAQTLEDDPEWEHLGTVEPRIWIEQHYEAVEQRDELLAAFQMLVAACDTGERGPDGKQRGTKMPERYAVHAAHDAIASVKGGA